MALWYHNRICLKTWMLIVILGMESQHIIIIIISFTVTSTEYILLMLAIYVEWQFLEHTSKVPDLSMPLNLETCWQNWQNIPQITWLFYKPQLIGCLLCHSDM